MNYNLPLSKDSLNSLKAGDNILLSGKMYVMRDAAHKRLIDDINHNLCPISIANSTVYYMAPCPTKSGEIIGSCGPTTSLRMDSFAPRLYSLGMSATIGKGGRSKEVVDAIIANKAIYLAAIGGCGALYKSCVISNKTIAYSELGAEALLELDVVDFPVIVAIDSKGHSIY